VPEAVAIANDSTAYVVYDALREPGQHDTDSPQLLTLRRTEEDWRIWHAGGYDGLLDGGFMGTMFFVPTAEQRLADLKTAADRIVAWPSEDAPRQNLVRAGGGTV
jgi:hypothetical protein